MAEISQTPKPSTNQSQPNTILGSVFGKRKRGRPAKTKVALPSELESPTSVTSATDTEETTMFAESQSSSMSAQTTTESSPSSTVSLMSPSGYVESGSMPNTIDLLQKLQPVNRQRLEILAEGRSEPIDVTIHQIFEFLCEEESEFCEAPADEALDWYLEVSQV